MLGMGFGEMIHCPWSWVFCINVWARFAFHLRVMPAWPPVQVPRVVIKGRMRTMGEFERNGSHIIVRLEEASSSLNASPGQMISSELLEQIIGSIQSSTDLRGGNFTPAPGEWFESKIQSFLTRPH